MNIYFIKTVCRQEGKTCVWNSQIECTGYCPETDSYCPASGQSGHSLVQKKAQSDKVMNGIYQAQGHFPASCPSLLQTWH
jgi:hypothetical protein